MNTSRLWAGVATLGALSAIGGIAGLMVGTRHLPAKVAMIAVGVLAVAGALVGARQAVTTGRNRR